MTPAETAQEIADSLRQTAIDFHLERLGNVYRLALRLERKQRRRPGQVLPIYVYAQAVRRHYGGPEEGGWYYDRSEVLEVRRAFSWQAAKRHARKLKEDYPTCPRGRFSVLGGDDIDVRFASDESFIPEDRGHPGSWC